MMVSENEVYERAIKEFGFKNQVIKCIEELSELQKELCKFSLGQVKVENIAEEIADVEIMIEQMKIGFNIGFFELNEVKSRKVCRLIKTINSQPEQPKIVSEEEKEAQFEAKCSCCLYRSMTNEEIAKLGKDPCGTCFDLCNWTPKGVLI